MNVNIDNSIFWAFSIYLEALAILPQLVLLQRSGNRDIFNLSPKTINVRKKIVQNFPGRASSLSALFPLDLHFSISELANTQVGGVV
ncbi:ER lumen protein-retaining receptor A [Gossypium australe]|uniref:ER lumen protein-retaining receptor A n=1 Tax=Gossypium australe TaxID=47621 RepID=A0A5B6X4P6_9ROSI|nr:ER lumen protein-retaining receptor A [Gossypium australe]